MTGQALSKLDLPDSPGVYFFKRGAEILYIGRATSLRDRVRSYFVSNIAEVRSPLIADMVKKADQVAVTMTDSVLEAIILEAKLIKDYQPPANIDEKDDKSFNHVVITKERFPQVFTMRAKDIKDETSMAKYKYIFGPFPNAGALFEALKFIRRIFPFRDQKCTPCDEQIADSKPCRPCFNRHIGLCPGVCTGEISAKEYARTILNIKLMFEGKKKKVISILKREMRSLAKAEEFEAAADVRSQLFALTHIRDVAMIKNGNNFNGQASSRGEVSTERVEAYDVAHIGGSNARGVMIVMEGDAFVKSEYRLFKLRRAKGGDDVGALKEVLERRLSHKEWPYPKLVVIDGGTGQLNAAKSVVPDSIQTVSVIKDDKHKAREILGKAGDFTKEIIFKANAESHRFAISRFRKAARAGWLPTI